MTRKDSVCTIDSITISVVIPVYNVAPYLEKCVNSVRLQSFPNLQIILVDDGSTDGSYEICDSLKHQDDRITVVHQENQGLSVARNTGMDLAYGEWIAFLDSDDWLEKDAYKTLLEIALNYEADISSCLSRTCSIGEKPSISNDTNQITIYDDIDTIVKELKEKKRLRVEVWNKLWKKSLVEKIRFVPGQVSEDVHFDRIAFLKANRIVHIDRTLHNYLVGRSGSTNSTFKIARFCVFDEYDALISDLEQINKTEASNAVSSMAIRYLLNMYIEAVDKKQSNEIKEKIVKKFQSYHEMKRGTSHIEYAETAFALSPSLYYLLSKMKALLIR